MGFWTRADTACEFAKFEVGKPVSIAQQAVQSVSRTNKHVKNLKLFAIADNVKAPSLVASTTGTGIGKSAEEPEDIKKTLTDGTVFYTETKNATQVTMPVRDKDGDIIAAAVINLEKSVLANRDLYRARASAVVIDLGKRIQDKRQLFEGFTAVAPREWGACQAVTVMAQLHVLVASWFAVYRKASLPGDHN